MERPAQFRVISVLDIGSKISMAIVLRETEQIDLLGALVIKIARAPKSYRKKGSDIRLAKKVFRNICIKAESFNRR